MDQYTRRIIGSGVLSGNVDGPALCCMFNEATSGHDWPKYLSSDNDPLFQYQRWKANLHALDVQEIKSLPHVPMSHPFVERLIGSVRRELLNHTLFLTVTDLENKLHKYQCYYNEIRCHSSRNGATSIKPGSAEGIDIKESRWQRHCRGLFHVPVAAGIANSPGTRNSVHTVLTPFVGPRRCPAPHRCTWCTVHISRYDVATLVRLSLPGGRRSSPMDAPGR
jgi:putative transposase